MTETSLERIRARAARERAARLEAEEISERAIREAYERHTELTLLQTVTAAANEAQSPEDAIQAAIDAVCAHTGWPVGHAYAWDGDAGELVALRTWNALDESRFGAFRAATERRRFAPGEGLPGRVVERGVAVWLPDVLADDNFPRVEAARSTGLRAAFGFPVSVGATVVAVLEFYSDRVEDPRARLLHTMRPVGVQLGWVFERRRAREETEALTRALETRAVELQRSNADLETFASAASHDLSEPLRTVAGFLGLLERRYADELDDRGRELIAYAVDGTVRMRSLIDGLLTFSRAGTRALDLQPIAVADVVDAVRSQLGELLADGATLRVDGDLGTVRADRTQLQRVIQNLVSNAVKFVGDGVTPEVVVAGAEAADGMREITVADNGIGVAPEFREKVFEMFIRLHDRATYDGSGIGLATCARVVARHGGQMWITDAPAGGSILHLTVPAADDPRPASL